jgi:hypothetical protein
MRYIRQYLLIALCAAGLSFIWGCGQSEPQISDLVGSWKQLPLNSTERVPQYYLFRADNTYSILQQGNTLAKYITKGICKYTGSYLTLSHIQRQYLIQRSGDTLRLLINPSLGDKYYGNIVLIRDASFTTETSWIPAATVKTRVPTTYTSLYGLCSVGSKLIGTQYPEKKLFVFNTNGQPQTDITTTEYYRGTTGIGSTIWATRYDKDAMQQLNLSGTVLTTLNIPKDAKSITSDGGSMLYLMDYLGTLYMYNLNNNVLSRPIATGLLFVSDITYRAGYLYSCNDKYIYKLDLATLQVVATYTQPSDTYVEGIDYDGTTLWEYSAHDSKGEFVSINID